VSIKVMTAVWPLRLSAFDKLVLLALADISDDEGQCYPSMRILTEKCGMDERTVQRSLKRLQGSGHVEREMRAGRSTVYRVTPEPPSNSHPRPIVTPVSLTPTPVSLTPPEKKKTSSLEPSPNRQPRKRVAIPEGPPPSNLNVEAWHRWEEYRRQIRKPIHSASLLSAQRKLAAFGTDQEPVVEQSIANGWQGLFPLKQQPKQKSAEHSEWM
jgi:helix-turn-helix protein